MNALLKIEGLKAGYGAAEVLSGISLTLEAGECLALLGRNGAGKTTLLDTIIGVTSHKGGSIVFAGQEISRRAPEDRAAIGIGWVPQERNIFRSLTVEENLTAIARPGPWTLEGVNELFPRLAERRRNPGDALSGGEQQMLAIGRALMLNPRLLLLDEPLEGLAPVIANEVMVALARLASEGLSIILVEQKARKVLPLTESAAVMDRGRIAWHGKSRALVEDEALLHDLLTPNEGEKQPR